jgi:Ni2+-binding GTPase involved in maturation of urease and hydrogenase
VEVVNFDIGYSVLPGVEHFRRHGIIFTTTNGDLCVFIDIDLESQWKMVLIDMKESDQTIGTDAPHQPG